MPTVWDMKARAPPNLPQLSSRDTNRSVKPPLYFSISKGSTTASNTPANANLNGRHTSRFSVQQDLEAANYNNNNNNNNSMKRNSVGTNSPTRKTGANQSRWKSRLIDVDNELQNTPFMRRVRTLTDMAQAEEANDSIADREQKSPLPTNVGATRASQLRRQQATARTVRGNANANKNEPSKAFSSPSVLAASKSSLYRAPLKPNHPLAAIDNQRREYGGLVYGQRGSGDIEQLEEEPFLEDFTEKRSLIIKWLDEVDQAERPPTPPSRFDDYVERSESPSHTATAIHIVYACDDSED